MASISTVLAFDVGTRRIGVAVGTPMTGARALVTVSADDDARLDVLIAEWRPDVLVVGLPLSTDGSEQSMTRVARDFGASLATRHARPVVFADERHTSQEAARRFASARAQGTRRRKDAADLDAVAAAVILEAWFADLPGDSGISDFG